MANFYMQTAHRLLHTFTLRGGKAYWQGKGMILTGCFCPTLDTDALWRNKLGIPTTFTQGLFHWNLHPPTTRLHPLVKDFLPPDLDQIKITLIPEDFQTIWVYQALRISNPLNNNISQFHAWDHGNPWFFGSAKIHSNPLLFLLMNRNMLLNIL